MLNIMPYSPAANKPLTPNRQPAFTNNSQNPETPEEFIKNFPKIESSKQLKELSIQAKELINNSAADRMTRINSGSITAQKLFEQAKKETNPELAKEGLIKAYEFKKIASLRVLADIPGNDAIINDKRDYGKWMDEQKKEITIKTPDDLKSFLNPIKESIDYAPDRKDKIVEASATAKTLMEKGKEEKDDLKLSKNILIKAYEFENLAYINLLQELACHHHRNAMKKQIQESNNNF